MQLWTRERLAPGWRSFGTAQISTSTDDPLNGSQCKKIDVQGSLGGLVQQPLCIRSGEVYRGSLWARGTLDGHLAVRLLDGTTSLAEQKFALTRQQLISIVEEALKLVRS